MSRRKIPFPVADPSWIEPLHNLIAPYKGRYVLGHSEQVDRGLFAAAALPSVAAGAVCARPDASRALRIQASANERSCSRGLRAPSPALADLLAASPTLDRREPAEPLTTAPERFGMTIHAP